MNISGQHNRIEHTTINIINAPDNDFSEIATWKDHLKSIIQKVPDKADTLKPVIQFLVTTTAPQKIYMLPYQDAVSKEQYIDLLLIISGTGAPFSELEPALEFPYIKDKKVCCSLHNEGNILQQLQEGHIFYSMNLTAENLVYDNGVKTYPLPSQEQIIQLKQQARELFSREFSKASAFYEAALFLIQKNHHPLIAFYLQQAIEATFRGILKALNGCHKRTHELRVLIKQCRRCAPELQTVFSSEEDQRLIALLDTAYLDARYTDGFKVDSPDIETIVKKTEQLQTMALQLVEKRTE